jgi:transposase InsO family protein
MDFITKIHRKVKQHVSIMVVVDKLTKESHFISVKTTLKEENIEEIYMREVSRLHGVPKEIVSARYSKFTCNFWKGFFKGFGMNLNLSTTYNPESNGKIERTNIIIEDMIIMYVMDQPSKWKYYIHLVEVAYNNGYQASLKMSLFEALYGRKCNTSVSWDNQTSRVVVGTYFFKGNGREDDKDKLEFKGFLG